MEADYKYTLKLINEGKLDEAHKLIQKNTDKLSCLLHAYIHRAKKDLSNANYWYKKAGVRQPNSTLAEEYEDLEKKVKG